MNKDVIEQMEYDVKTGQLVSRNEEIKPCRECNNRQEYGWGKSRCKRFKLAVHSLVEGTQSKYQDCSLVRARFFKNGNMQCQGFEPIPPAPKLNHWQKFCRFLLYGE